MKAQVLLALALLASACVARTGEQANQIRESDLETVVITLERSACFGPCPIYTLSIQGDGTVTYDGKRFVKVEGRRTYKIPKSDVKKLVEQFYKIGYFSLKDEYTQVENPDGTVTVVTDLPTHTTSIAIGGRKKRVVNYFGGPESLRELENKIDEISRSAKYVRRT